IDRRFYACEHIAPGEALELVRERTNRNDDHAVAYCHRGVHLGYVPKQQRWVSEALDDGLSLRAIAVEVKVVGYSDGAQNSSAPVSSFSTAAATILSSRRSRRKVTAR